MNLDVLHGTFSTMPRLHTDRLLLRAMKVGDWQDMYSYASLEQTTRYLLWDPHTSPQYTRGYLTQVQQWYRDKRFFDWALVLRTSHRMIGTCGFVRFDEENESAEVGYVLHPDYWGRGLAAEALQEVLSFGFDRLELHRIWARYMQGNTQSARVMEKCGMRYEGTFPKSMKIKGQFCTISEYAVLREEFLSFRASHA